jgi:hypothetical protein
MSEWDSFLEQVAFEQCEQLPKFQEHLEVLRAKLLPLLEAGQVLHDRMPREKRTKSSSYAVRRKTQSMSKKRIDAISGWDAAKQAARKGQPE